MCSITNQSVVPKCKTNRIKNKNKLREITNEIQNKDNRDRRKPEGPERDRD